MRKTYNLIKVALALVTDASGRHWGYELSKRSGVPSGVMYPILQRMRDEGWLAEGWEDKAQARHAKRLRRHYYTLTDTGKVALDALASSLDYDTK